MLYACGAALGGVRILLAVAGVKGTLSSETEAAKDSPMYASVGPPFPALCTECQAARRGLSRGSILE